MCLSSQKSAGITSKFLKRKKKKKLVQTPCEIYSQAQGQLSPMSRNTIFFIQIILHFIGFTCHLPCMDTNTCSMLDLGVHTSLPLPDHVPSRLTQTLPSS